MLAQGFGMPSSPINRKQLTSDSQKLPRTPRNQILPRSRRSRNFPRKYANPSSKTRDILISATGFYLISFWYKREESQKRFTIYWCSVLVASAFGGLLASAIANMKMVRGLSAWRWVFILEGMATIVIGIAAYFLVSDFPEDAKWLTEEERAFVMTRAAADKADGEEITFKKVLLFFTNVKHLLAGIIYFGKPSFPPP